MVFLYMFYGSSCPDGFFPPTLAPFDLYLIEDDRGLWSLALACLKRDRSLDRNLHRDFRPVEPERWSRWSDGDVDVRSRPPGSCLVCCCFFDIAGRITVHSGTCSFRQGHQSKVSCAFRGQLGFHWLHWLTNQRIETCDDVVVTPHGEAHQRRRKNQ